jgi:hypothetical protein
MKKFFVSLLVFTILFSASAVFAHDLYDKYPNRGYLFMSKSMNYSGLVYVTSNNCNTSEVNAFSKVKSSTANTTEMSRWPDGIDMKQYSCDSIVTNYVDIDIEYSDFSKTHGGGTYGGENHSTLAPSSYCEYWGVTSPCGSHPSTVHINQTKWDSTSSTGRERLIMHETAHSMGLAHHCSGDSITNNGSSSCNGGKWTAIMSYQATDRTGIDSQYAK